MKLSCLRGENELPCSRDEGPLNVCLSVQVLVMIILDSERLQDRFISQPLVVGVRWSRLGWGRTRILSMLLFMFTIRALTGGCHGLTSYFRLKIRNLHTHCPILMMIFFGGSQPPSHRCIEGGGGAAAATKATVTGHCSPCSVRCRSGFMWGLGLTARLFESIANMKIAGCALRARGPWELALVRTMSSGVRCGLFSPCCRFLPKSVEFWVKWSANHLVIVCQTLYL